MTTLLNLARSTGTVFNLSTSILSTSVFKLARFFFDAELLTLHVSHSLNQFSLHNCLNLVQL